MRGRILDYTARLGSPLGTWHEAEGCGPVSGPASCLLRKTNWLARSLLPKAQTLVRAQSLSVMFPVPPLHLPRGAQDIRNEGAGFLGCRNCTTPERKQPEAKTKAAMVCEGKCAPEELKCRKNDFGQSFYSHGSVIWEEQYGSMNGQSSTFSQGELQPLVTWGPHLGGWQRKTWGPSGVIREAAPQRRLPELTWCPTVFLCSLAVWPGLPLVGFEGMRVRGTRPEEVAEVGLMAFSSSWNNSGSILNWVRNSKRKSHSEPKLKWKSLQKH